MLEVHSQVHVIALVGKPGPLRHLQWSVFECTVRIGL
jgi:hypothetical protein